MINAKVNTTDMVMPATCPPVRGGKGSGPEVGLVVGTPVSDRVEVGGATSVVLKILAFKMHKRLELVVTRATE